MACTTGIPLCSTFRFIYTNNRECKAPDESVNFLLCSPRQRGAPALPHAIKDSEFLVPAQPRVLQVFDIFENPSRILLEEGRHVSP